MESTWDILRGPKVQSSVTMKLQLKLIEKMEKIEKLQELLIEREVDIRKLKLMCEGQSDQASGRTGSNEKVLRKLRQELHQQRAECDASHEMTKTLARELDLCLIQGVLHLLQCSSAAKRGLATTFSFPSNFWFFAKGSPGLPEDF